MVALAQPQLSAVREAVAACTAVGGVDEFRERVVSATHGLVTCDAVAYNEVPLDGSAPVTLIDPPDISFPEAGQVLARHASDNPLITHYARTGDAKPYMLSDFLSLSALRRTALYNELYRRMGFERQLAMVLPSTRDLAIAVTINREGRDFDEQDRAVVDAFRPFAGEAFRHAVALSGLSQALDELDEGVVVVDREGRIAHMTRRRSPSSGGGSLLMTPCAHGARAAPAVAARGPFGRRGRSRAGVVRAQPRRPDAAHPPA